VKKNTYIEKKYMLLLIGLLALIGLIALKDFLTLHKLFIYTDVAKDIWLNAWPNYFHFSEYLKTNGFPTWSMNIGLGANIFAGSLNRISVVDPFVLATALFATKFVVYFFAYFLYVKIILAGVFFYLYLKKAGFRSFSSTIGALLYAFSSYMILYSGWYNYTTAVVFLPLLLLAIEVYLKDNKKWQYLVFSYAWLALYHPMDVYFYSILPACYFLFRHLWLAELPNKALMKSGGVCLLKYIGFIVLGVGLGSIFFIPNFMELLQSPRVTASGSVLQSFAHSFISFQSTIEFKTTIGRFFSNDMFGIGNQFTGWQNYLEAPMLYAGLFPLIILPQALRGLGKKKTILLLSLFVFSLLILFMPGLRFVLNGFSGEYYRLVGYFTPFVIIYLSVLALDVIAERKIQLSKLILSFTYFFLMAVLILLNISSKEMVDENVLISAVIFLSVYFLLLLAHARLGWKLFKIILLAVVCSELLIFSCRTVDRPTLERASYTGSRGYNDSSARLVKWINSTDKSLFRIDKNFDSVFCCNDALMQDYQGTDFYQSFMTKGYLDFLTEMHLIDSSFAYRSFDGFVGRDYLRNLVGVKYFITKSSASPFQGYELIGQDEGSYIYKNKNFFGLGLVFDKYVSLQDFSSLTDGQKDQVLLSAVIIDEGQSMSKAVPKESIDQIVESFDYQSVADRNKKNGAKISSYNQKRIAGEIVSEKDGVLFFSIPYNSGWQLYIDGKRTPTIKVDMGFLGAEVGKGGHYFELVYHQPYLSIGIGITIISIATLLLCMWMKIVFITRKLSRNSRVLRRKMMKIFAPIKTVWQKIAQSKYLSISRQIRPLAVLLLCLIFPILFFLYNAKNSQDIHLLNQEELRLISDESVCFSLNVEDDNGVLVFTGLGSIRGRSDNRYNWEVPEYNMQTAVYTNNVLVLKDSKGSVYKAKTYSVTDPEVSVIINDVRDHSKDGFVARIRKSDLKIGEVYTIGILITRLNGNQTIIYSNRTVSQ